MLDLKTSSQLTNQPKGPISIIDNVLRQDVGSQRLLLNHQNQV